MTTSGNPHQDPERIAAASRSPYIPGQVLVAPAVHIGTLNGLRRLRQRTLNPKRKEIACLPASSAPACVRPAPSSAGSPTTWRAPRSPGPRRAAGDGRGVAASPGRGFDAAGRGRYNPTDVCNEVLARKYGPEPVSYEAAVKSAFAPPAAQGLDLDRIADVVLNEALGALGREAQAEPENRQAGQATAPAAGQAGGADPEPLLGTTRPERGLLAVLGRLRPQRLILRGRRQRPRPLAEGGRRAGGQVRRRPGPGAAQAPGVFD
jgi:hypothetical protein